MKDEIEIGFDADSWGPRMLLHRRVVLNLRAEFAMQLALGSSRDVANCCDMASQMFEEFERRRWITDVPDMKECQRMGEDARKEVRK